MSPENSFDLLLRTEDNEKKKNNEKENIEYRTMNSNIERKKWYGFYLLLRTED